MLLVCFVLSGLLHAPPSYSASLWHQSHNADILFLLCPAQPSQWMLFLQAYDDASVKGIAGELKQSPIVQAIRHDLVFILVYTTFPWACRDPGLKCLFLGASLARFRSIFNGLNKRFLPVFFLFLVTSFLASHWSTLFTLLLSTNERFCGFRGARMVEISMLNVAVTPG